MFKHIRIQMLTTTFICILPRVIFLRTERHIHYVVDLYLGGVIEVT